MSKLTTSCEDIILQHSELSRIKYDKKVEIKKKSISFDVKLKIYYY